MKNIVILIISFLITIGFGIFEINYLEKTSKYLKSDINYIMNLTNNNKMEEANKHILELNKTWHNIKYNWGYFINLDRTDEIDKEIIKLSNYIKTENKENIIISASTIIYQINIAIYREKVKLENII